MVAEIVSRVFEKLYFDWLGHAGWSLRGIYRFWESSTVPAATRRKPGFTFECQRRR
jgi:hypothetical protein